jgi:hypothetical protein
MKHLFSYRHIQLLVSVCLAAMILPVIEAEPRCPGNIASVTPRFVQHALIVIPVKVNQVGPFDFMVDTGSQVTAIQVIRGPGAGPRGEAIAKFSFSPKGTAVSAAKEKG